MKRVGAKKPTRAAKALETAIVGRMPERNLIDVLCGVENHTDWSKHFGPLSGSEPKLENPRERYLIVAFGYGTNLGPVQTARHTRGLVSAHEVGYVNRRHVSTKKLEAAYPRSHKRLRKARSYQEYGVPARRPRPMGSRVDLYEENLISEYHIRYGGYGGIAYHHISPTPTSPSSPTSSPAGFGKQSISSMGCSKTSPTYSLTPSTPTPRANPLQSSDSRICSASTSCPASAT